MLEDERRKAEGLAGRLQHAEEQARTSTGRLDEVERREREAHEKSREQVRILFLQLSTHDAYRYVLVGPRTRPHQAYGG